MIKYRLQRYVIGECEAEIADTITFVSMHEDLEEGLEALHAEEVTGRDYSWIHYELVEIIAVNEGHR